MPHFIVLFFLWIAFAVVSVIAFFAVFFTGRYPRHCSTSTLACSAGHGASASTATGRLRDADDRRLPAVPARHGRNRTTRGRGWRLRSAVANPGDRITAALPRLISRVVSSSRVLRTFGSAGLDLFANPARHPLSVGEGVRSGSGI